MWLLGSIDLLSVVATLSTFFAGFYLWAKYKQSYWARRGVYSPPSHWLFGHFKDSVFFRAAPPIVFGDLHNAHPDKPMIGVYMFQKPFLVIRDPDLLKTILVKDSNYFPDHYFGSSKSGNTVSDEGIFQARSPGWKDLRVKLSPVFSSAKQKLFFNKMLESANNLKQYLSKKVPEGKADTLDFRDICTKYTTDNISSLTFGVTTNSFDESEFYTRSRSTSEQTLYRTLQMFCLFFYPSLTKYIGSSMFGKHTNYMRNIFRESMATRQKSTVKRGDLIDVLLELKNSDNSIEEDYLLAQSSMVFVAGLETSAVTMSFTILELAKKPELLEKVREEIRDKIGSGPITYEIIAEMQYLNQVISETLRLYPPAPLVDRIAAQDYKIPGTDVVIEKGTGVYAALPGLHLDPNYHADPLKYDPDRFSESRKQDIKPCTYMPFGTGPRACIGMRTGLLQMMVGLITILRDYEIALNPKYNNEISPKAIFMAPKDGMRLEAKWSPIV